MSDSASFILGIICASFVLVFLFIFLGSLLRRNNLLQGKGWKPCRNSEGEAGYVNDEGTIIGENLAFPSGQALHTH